MVGSAGWRGCGGAEGRCRPATPPLQKFCWLRWWQRLCDGGGERASGAICGGRVCVLGCVVTHGQGLAPLRSRRCLKGPGLPGLCPGLCPGLPRASAGDGSSPSGRRVALCNHLAGPAAEAAGSSGCLGWSTGCASGQWAVGWSLPSGAGDRHEGETVHQHPGDSVHSGQAGAGQLALNPAPLEPQSWWLFPFAPPWLQRDPHGHPRVTFQVAWVGRGAGHRAELCGEGPLCCPRGLGELGAAAVCFG